MIDNEQRGAADAGGSAAAGAQRWFFDGWSRIYDLPLVQWTTYRPVHDAILRELRRVACRRVLDVGCGTGQLAARIVREHPDIRVTGCDFSHGMLAHAAARRVRVHWVQADAGRLPFHAGAFDAIVSTEAFHWFPDQARALAEFHRLLAPGGRVLIALVNTPSSGIASILHAGSRLLGEPFYWPTSLEMRSRLERAGFAMVHQERIFRLPGGLLFPPVLTVASRPQNAAEGAQR